MEDEDILEVLAAAAMLGVLGIQKMSGRPEDARYEESLRVKAITQAQLLVKTQKKMARKK